MSKSLQSDKGLNLVGGERNLTYLYGISDFWTFIFEDPEMIQQTVEATTFQMSEAYSKFLQLTSTISLSDIQETSNSQIKLVLLDSSMATGNLNEYKLPEKIVSSSFISNRPLLPTEILENDVHFFIDPVTNTIRFSKGISDFVFPARDTGNGVTQWALWLTDVAVDEELIHSHYGKLLNIDPQNLTTVYKRYVQGLYYLYSHGPDIKEMERGLNLVMGVPIARETEEVTYLEQHPETGNWVVATNNNAYFIPFGLKPDVIEGDFLTQGKEIASWIEVTDWVETDNWWIDLAIPPEVLPDAPDASGRTVAVLGSNTEWLMSEYLKTHTFLVKLKTEGVSNLSIFDNIQDVVQDVKPSYTFPIYIWEVPLDEEILDLIDTEIDFSANVDMCENLLVPDINTFRRDDAKHDRGCPSFMRYNTTGKTAYWVESKINQATEIDSGGDGNLLHNGTFTSGTEGWFTTSAADAPISSPDGISYIEMNTSSNSVDHAVYNTVRVEPNTTYNVTFDAESLVPGYSLQVRVSEGPLDVTDVTQIDLPVTYPTRSLQTFSYTTGAACVLGDRFTAIGYTSEWLVAQRVDGVIIWSQDGNAAASLRYPLAGNSNFGIQTDSVITALGSPVKQFVSFDSNGFDGMFVLLEDGRLFAASNSVHSAYHGTANSASTETLVACSFGTVNATTISGTLTDVVKICENGTNTAMIIRADGSVWGAGFLGHANSWDGYINNTVAGTSLATVFVELWTDVTYEAADIGLQYLYGGEEIMYIARKAKSDGTPADMIVIGAGNQENGGYGDGSATLSGGAVTTPLVFSKTVWTVVTGHKAERIQGLYQGCLSYIGTGIYYTGSQNASGAIGGNISGSLNVVESWTLVDNMDAPVEKDLSIQPHLYLSLTGNQPKRLAVDSSNNIYESAATNWVKRADAGSYIITIEDTINTEVILSPTGLLVWEGEQDDTIEPGSTFSTGYEVIPSTWEGNTNCPGYNEMNLMFMVNDGGVDSKIRIHLSEVSDPLRPDASYPTGTVAIQNVYETSTSNAYQAQAIHGRVNRSRNFTRGQVNYISRNTPYGHGVGVTYDVLQNNIESGVPPGLTESILEDIPTWYWKLDETTGLVAVDTMGNNNLSYSRDVSTSGDSVASSRDDGLTH